MFLCDFYYIFYRPENRYTAEVGEVGVRVVWLKNIVCKPPTDN